VTPTIAIVGVGNLLLSDDGAGIMPSGGCGTTRASDPWLASSMAHHWHGLLPRFAVRATLIVDAVDAGLRPHDDPDGLQRPRSTEDRDAETHQSEFPTARRPALAGQASRSGLVGSTAAMGWDGVVAEVGRPGRVRRWRAWT